MGLHIEQFAFNGFQENTLVIDDGDVCVIVDPGCYERAEEQELYSYITEKGIKPVAVLLTHSHIDHVLGLRYVTEAFDIPYYQHILDTPTLNAVSDYAHVYGFGGYTPVNREAKRVEDFDQLTFGEMKFDVRFTPGHAPGHVVYYMEDIHSVINGDVLFAGSFGRVDLPGGDLETLKQSIFNILFQFPEETIVYCGHGPTTTIGKEKMTNYIHQY